MILWQSLLISILVIIGVIFLVTRIFKFVKPRPWAYRLWKAFFSSHYNDHSINPEEELYYKFWLPIILIY